MFNFLKLLDRKKTIIIVILGIISGIVNFFFLAFINIMIGLIINKKNVSEPVYIIIFLLLLLFAIWSKRTLAYLVIKFSQRTFWKLRSEILNTILKANFFQFNLRKNQIHTALIQDVGTLTNFSLWIIQFLSAIIMTIGCFVYMGLESKQLLLITIGVSVLGIVIYSIGAHLNKRKFTLSRELENNFMKSFLDILSGFKEIHMNPKIGQDIFNKKIRNIANESYVNNINAYKGFLNIQIVGEILFYALIAFILIYSSFFIKESPITIVNFVFILLYLLGSLNTIMQVIPVFTQAKVSLDKIYKLKSELKDERFENRISNYQIAIENYNILDISELVYTYKSKTDELQTCFSIGPVNFSLKKGDVVFIYGGNGSGKTTLINALLGILQSDSGTIKFNNNKLNQENYGTYRELFSVVFSDFHLFDELYGFEKISEIEIGNYLELFELNEKVIYESKSFTSNGLSTGQRKRLALVIALLRSKPILILDEWAADQDPVFRKKFYKQIIPELKFKGFSIIAITHDDAYYHVADQLYKMEFGKLKLETLVNVI